MQREVARGEGSSDVAGHLVGGEVRDDDGDGLLVPGAGAVSEGLVQHLAERGQHQPVPRHAAVTAVQPHVRAAVPGPRGQVLQDQACIWIL